MGLNQNLKYLVCTVLFLFLLLGICFPSPSSSHEIQPKVPHEVPAQYQEFYGKNIKNTETFAMNGVQDLRKKRIRSSKKNIWRKKIKKERTSRPFAVMLPKGFVPPSGSSPCSNRYPDSVRATFYCDLSTANP